jgi:hypothetical protein
MARFGRYEVPGMKIIDEQSAIDRELDVDSTKARGWWAVWTLALLLIVLAYCATSDAAVSAEWKVNLLRGSTTIDTPTGSTEAEAWAKCLALIPKSAATSTTYRCQTPVFSAVVTPDPATCPPPPASTTRTQQCPAGTTGTWQQTSTSTVGPAPACTLTTSWAPASAPAGACTPVSTIALVYSATAGGTYAALEGATVAGGINVRLNGACPNPAGPWSFAVDGAAVNTENLCPYELGGDNYLLDTKTLANGAHTIRVVGSQTITATFTVNNVTAPPPPPANGSATLRWTPPTQNSDGSALTDLAGYRVLYGQSATALTQTIDVNNASVSTYVVDKLSSGAWYFAVRSYNASGVESANSGVATKVIAP